MEGAVLLKNYNLALATDRVTLQAVAVPEPGTWTMMIAGFLGIGLMLRRARRTLVPTALAG